MKHCMNLYNDSFQAIKNKTKTIEMRLYDEKRKTIQIGDMIVFTNTVSNETLDTEVIEISVYRNFVELYSHYDKISIGYGENDVANPSDMLLYYSKEKIEKYGVLAIGIRVL